jgi:DNA-binding transcriptional MocR family regulator
LLFLTITVFMETYFDNRHEFLYQQVAERFEHLIEQGILNAGDKLLSVRSLSKEQGISISTAFQAYSQLEMKGLIEARPKSGYYVRFTPRELPKMPSSEQVYQDPNDVSVNEMIAMIYNNLTDEHVIHFSLATPDVELIPKAKLNKSFTEALRSTSHGCLSYENIPGNLLLRKQIAKLSFNWGGVFKEDDIVTTQGCMEALVFCLKSVTQPGDTIAIDQPTYFGIFNVMNSLGLKVMEIPHDPVSGLNLPYLQKAINRHKIKACLFVTNFNNPTGISMPDEQKKKLVEMLAEKEIPLIEDDIYGELFFGKNRPLTCKSFDKKGLVLYCSSISKSLAPGYRVGWVIPGRYKQDIIRQKFMHTISSATPTQTAVGLFMERGRFELHLRNIRRALHTQCLRYIQAITEYFPENIKMSRPQGGYVLWIELDKKVNAFDLYQRAIRQQISIAPGQIFSTNGGYSNYIRLSFGMKYTEEIRKSLKTLGQIIRKMQAE